MSKRLPSNPNLEHLKKQAKQLVKDHKAGQVEAFVRMKAALSRLASATVQDILAAEFTLCQAQFVIAREYGFETWQALVDAVEKPEGASDAFVAEYPGFQQLLSQIDRAAGSGLPVLIVGEPGTGKGLVARWVHRASKQKAGPFFQVACGIQPGLLVESDLFGHEKGAFTGAQARKMGKVEVAQGGTVFLDDVGALSGSTQARLVQLLETATFERIGGHEVLEADVRIVAATETDLVQRVAQGTFRQDLAFLLEKVQIEIPPLRNRREDIPVLVNHFAAQMASHLNRETPHLSDDAGAALQAYDWPGNVRELEHRVQRAVAACDGAVLGRDAFAF